jgi:hypothetical protein
MLPPLAGPNVPLGPGGAEARPGGLGGRTAPGLMYFVFLMGALVMTGAKAVVVVWVVGDEGW